MPSEQGVHERRDLLLQGGINEISDSLKEAEKALEKTSGLFTGRRFK